MRVRLVPSLRQSAHRLTVPLQSTTGERKLDASRCLESSIRGA